MVCCVLITSLIAVLVRPLVGMRANPLAWRAGDLPPRAAWRVMLDARARSFAHAFAGIRFVLRNEPNMRIHLVMATIAILAGLWFGIEPADWRWLAVAIALVLTSEALNTAVEQCCDAVSRQFNPAIKAAKDVAAGAVLICAVGSALIGIGVFAPYIIGVGHALYAPMCGASP